MPQPLGGAGLNMTLHSSHDPASASLAAAGAAASSFKLPNIARATHFSQAGAPASHPVGYVTAGAHPLNTLAQASGTTHHHLNVTLGEDKFYLTAKEDHLQHARLPNIANQSGSSSRLKTQLGNEYVGLMSKKSKVGSVDFNVQDSFALGGPAFNVSGARGGDSGKDAKMLTIDPEMHTRLRTLQDTDLRRPRASRSSNRGVLPAGGARNDGRLGGSLQANAEGPDPKKDTP